MMKQTPWEYSITAHLISPTSLELLHEGRSEKEFLAAQLGIGFMRIQRVQPQLAARATRLWQDHRLSRHPRGELGRVVGLIRRAASLAELAK